MSLLWLKIRHTLGRALRETGQALDRVGIRGRDQALKKRIVGDDPHIFDDFLSRHRHQMPLLERGRPKISPDVAYLAPCSSLIGTVQIGAGSSVWYGAVLRGDYGENASSFRRDNDEPWLLNENRFVDGSSSVGGGIYIGEDSNVQDGCVITARKGHTVIGNGVTIGHLAQIHSSTVHDHSLIGMGSMILEGSVVEEESFVAGGAVVPPNTRIPSGELWVGNPARKLRNLTEEERAKLHYQAAEYVKVATGQRGVMELGGNIPETLIQHMMIGAPETNDNVEVSAYESVIPDEYDITEEVPVDEVDEDEEPLKAEGR